MSLTTDTPRPDTASAPTGPQGDWTRGAFTRTTTIGIAVGAIVLGALTWLPSGSVNWARWIIVALLAYMVLTGERWWKSLPDDVRTDLELILLEVTHERNRFAYQLSELNRMNVVQDGGRVVNLSDGERSQWVNTLGPIWAQFENEIGPALIASAVAAGTGTSGF